MRLGIASWSFLLITLVFLVVKDGNARKVAVKTEMDNQLMKPVHHDFKQSPTEDLMLVEGSDTLKLNKNSTDEKEAGEDKDDEDLNYEDDSDDDDSDDDDSDDDEDDDDEDGRHHKKKGKQDSDEEEEEEGHKDEHRKLIMDHVKENDKDGDHVDDGSDRKKKGKKDHEKEHKDEHKKIIIMNHVKENDKDGDDHVGDEGGHHKKKGKQDHKKEHKDEHKKLIMDPELDVFFTPNDLQVGKTMRAYFAKKNSSTSPKFLPREEAEQIPFSSKMLSSILKFFSIPKHSPQAKDMKRTLKTCEFEAMEGETETKFCATSLESVLDSASQVFGSDAQLKVLTTTHITNSTVLLQNYTIREVKEISVPNPKVLGCHPMPYPYAVFYCQSQRNDTNLYDVLVEGENGAKVQATAVCHVDTSKWDSHHVSFRVLNLAPGTSPVCHFFNSKDLVLVLSPSMQLHLNDNNLVMMR